MLLVGAILAAPVGILACAGDGSEWPIKGANVWPTLISCAGRANEYPPPLPFFEKTKPALRSSPRIVSRNFFGISFASAMSFTSVASPTARPAR